MTTEHSPHPLELSPWSSVLDFFQVGTWSPKNMVAWGTNQLAVHFSDYGSGNGIWNYNGTSWSKLTDWIPETWISWGSAEVTVSFTAYGSGNGIWSHNGTSWSKKIDWIPNLP